MKKQLLCAIAAFALAGCANMDSVLGAITAPPQGSASSGGNAQISTAEQPVDVASGLRAALSQGVTTAINTLGKTGGFWDNPSLRLPLPSNLAKAEKTLRKLGMGSKVDEFQLALNQAAEQAVPQAAQVFGDALKQMTLADAQGILKGGNDAATQYFRRTSGTALAAKMEPIVASVTQKVGVTQLYKQLVGDNAALLALAGVQNTDIDRYVTEKAMDGLFSKIAEEEGRIRTDPMARGTELLKQVFGGQ